MNVLLISQCDKRALTETRRILDQFAERRGERTWQTPITQDGLDTLHRLLRKTARKNTAVACHWIRGVDHSELIWVVGDRRRFNALGAVPTNATQTNILKKADENDWHSADLIRMLVDLAGLLHDLGKAIDAFQERLTKRVVGRNLIRHEWVSLRLLEAFVGEDDDATWLARLANPGPADDRLWLERLRKDGLDGAIESPFKTLHRAPLAQALGWLVLTHHRLPKLPDKTQFQISGLPGVLTQVQPAWNEGEFEKANANDLQPYWRFSHGLPVTSDAWRTRASCMARCLLQACAASPAQQPLANPFVMHLSRLCLMLADHHYSRLEDSPADRAERLNLNSGSALLANTIRKTGNHNQPLDEHLLGVAQHGSEVARFLPRFAQSLPHLGPHKRLRQRATQARYRWQDKAADLATSLREASQQHGAFIVNMASTGCGKTLANARVMQALADPQLGMRCAFAMGLRTLTLQTGQAFRSMLGLNDADLAVLVGGSANRELFKHHEQQAELTGSASSQALLEEDVHVGFEGDIEHHPLLRRAVADPQVRKLLVAPLLVCTIDHLTPATESERGGRQIAPMLRLLSGDLVLDEPDDFDLTDLPALTRLVHWAGLLGSRVLLSSATLPPALVQGLFEAYRNGRHHHQRNRGARPGGADTPPAVACAWIDEFHQHGQACADERSFESAHAEFAARRHATLAQMAKQPRRRAELLPLNLPGKWRRNDLAGIASAFAPHVLNAALRLHGHHAQPDPVTGQPVSFGLVRIANIETLYEVALALYRQTVPAGVRIHLCVYHSRHPLLVRSAIERQLDLTLQRHDPDAVFSLPDIRARVDAEPDRAHVFIVLGSPVTEVGRDHDYDWAVVEPSSMRSFIQLAGRVRRHRDGGVDTPNILIFTRNLRSFLDPGSAAFCKPGFESDGDAFRLASHDLGDLLDASQWATPDARPRIVCPPVAQLQPQHNLVDLEHARLRAHMLPRAAEPQPARQSSRDRRNAAPQATPARLLNASTWWQQAPQDALLTALLPQVQRFRKETPPFDVDVVLLPDDDGIAAVLHRIVEQGRGQGPLYEPNAQRCQAVPDAALCSDGILPWGVTDYMTELSSLAEALELPLRVCAKRFGVARVRPNDNGWRYHPALGFAKRRDS